MTRVWCWCPGYGPWHGDAVTRALRDARAFGDPRGWVIDPAAGLADTTRIGCWHPLAHRLADAEAGWDHEWWWPLRGGYGCIHLVPWLLERPGPAPRLIGFSDLTVLHAVWAVRGWGPSYHAWMPESGGGERAQASLGTLLDGNELIISHQQDPAARVLVPGSAGGTAFCGCLSVLVGLVGTPAMPDLRGRILCLEDVDERPYRVDRHLSQLWLAGCLDGIAGLVIGTLPEANPPDRGPRMDAVIGEWATRLAVPTLYGLPFGHVADPWSLTSGGRMGLDLASDHWRISAQA